MVLDGLELEDCEEVYIKSIQAVFGNLKEIRNYLDWNVVVAKNAGSLNAWRVALAGVEYDL